MNNMKESKEEFLKAMKERLTKAVATLNKERGFPQEGNSGLMEILLFTAGHSFECGFVAGEPEGARKAVLSFMNTLMKESKND